MRVVLTVNFSPWSRYSGGGQRSTHNVATALSELGHDVTVIYTRPPWEHVSVPMGLRYEIRWAALLSPRSRSNALLRPFTAVSVADVLRRILGSSTIDVVHGNGEEAALVGTLRSEHRFAFVMTPRYPWFPEAMRGQRWRAWHRWPRYAVKHNKYLALGGALAAADVCCPTSKSAAGDIENVYGVSPSKVRVVPNGVSELYLKTNRSTDAASGPLFFYGRLSRDKGVLDLVEALGRMGTSAPPCIIVGRGDQEEPLTRRIAELGLGARIELRPWAEPEQLAEMLSRAAIAVLPSWVESFGNTMAEAMATGAPLVTTRVGSIPEVVEHERTGLLVPPRDPDALAAAIARLRNDKAFAESLGRAARAHVQDHYTWDSVARSYVETYAQLLS